MGLEEINFNQTVDQTPKKPEQIAEGLSLAMKMIADETNLEAGEKVADEENHIDIKAFKNERGFKAMNDKSSIYQKEKFYSGFFDENVKKFFKKENGLPANISEQVLQDKMVEAWRSKQKNERSFLLEKAITVLLHKVLAKDYLVIRSSKFDDMENGIDNLLVNKHTGDVLCAFDEINSYHDGKRLSEKMEKIKKKMKKGGSAARYGLTYKKGKIKKTSFDSLPNFCLALSDEEAEQAFQDIDPDIHKEPSEKEIALIKLLFSCVDEQIADLLAEPEINDSIKNKIQNFQNLSDYIKNL